ncbi:MAG: hypothetical protein IT361_18615 [Gemmatimonadaceae bacterium]|nr:hypothetical protein [Gemmatimonadaceae bacterium]
MTTNRLLTIALASITLAACGGGTEQAADTATTPAAAPAATGQTPDPGGTIIPVDMITDDQGNNRFEPATFEAKRGDVIRFKLVVGVHNVHFLPDSNPGVQGLPPAGQMLQAPGQVEDVKVTWGPGSYYFQCDPHALLGMVGRVTVK